MGIKIADFVAPEKPRPENEFDKDIEALAKFEDGTKAAVISEQVADFAKVLRKFREAAKHAGYRTRERTRTEDVTEDEDGVKTGTITASFTISKRKAEVTAKAEDSVDTQESDDDE
ncbi:hypothetical protein Curie_4 [Microbacterium phage Curie]